MCATTVAVAGAATRLEGSTAAAMADLTAALAVAPPSDAPEELLLRSAPGKIAPPNDDPDRVVQHVRYWSDGDEQIVATGPGRTARVGAGRAVLDPGSGGVRGVHGLLLPVLGLLFAQQNACLLHGGAFLSDGRAVLVLGGSGRGKSTLITAALSSGRRVLSDDLLVLRRRNGHVEVCGVPQPLALPGDQAHHPVVGPSLPDDPRARRAPARAVPLDHGAHPLLAVVLVDHSAEPGGSLEVVDARSVFRMVMASSLEGYSPTTARMVFPYAAAVSHLPAWRLGHAADPVVRLDAARAWIDRLETASA